MRQAGLPSGQARSSTRISIHIVRLSAWVRICGPESERIGCASAAGTGSTLRSNIATFRLPFPFRRRLSPCLVCSYCGECDHAKRAAISVHPRITLRGQSGGQTPHRYQEAPKTGGQNSRLNTSGPLSGPCLADAWLDLAVAPPSRHAPRPRNVVSTQRPRA